MMNRALIPLMLSVASVATAQQTSPPLKRPPMTVTTLPGVKIAEAVPAVGTNRIYYTTRDGELFMYDRTAKVSTLVARGQMSEIALSPLNDRIAFGRGSEGNGTDIHIWTLPLDPVTGATAGPVRRTSLSPGHAPSFSPDGQRIAFAARESARNEYVAVMPASGGAEHVLDKVPRSLELIRWSPDGQTLFVGDWGRTGDKTAAYRVPAAGGNATLIAKTGSSYPGPSPDGRLIAVTDQSWDSLLVMRPDGYRLGALSWINGADGASWNGNARLFVPNGRSPWKLRAYFLADGVTRALRTDSASDLREPHWSPDGRRIAVIQRGGELEVMNADGSGARRVAKDALLVMNCHWSPDGRWILFARWVTGNTWSLKAVEVATGREVTFANKVTYPGGIFFASAARWAPDSKSLFYTQFIDTIAGFPLGSRFALHVATLTGTDRVLREVTKFAGKFINVPIFGDSTMEVSTRSGARFIAPLRSGTPETALMPESRMGVSVPSFSPDGRRVAYRINPNAPDNSVFSQIEVMQIDGSRRTRIDVPFNVATGPRNPMFLPDPRELLVAGQEKRDGGEISFYRVSLDGGPVKKLLTIPGANYGRNDWAYELSPDGKTLLYITDEPPFSTFTDIDLSAFLKLAPAKKSP